MQIKHDSPALRLGSICGALLLALLFPFLAAADQRLSSDARQPAGMLGENTAWAIPWYEVEGSQPGPVVVLTGGMHGNEPAGSHAAEQIRHWPIQRGRLVVVPQVNPLGLAADMRWFPPRRNERSLRDLNRNFPTTANEQPRTPLCQALWDLVGRCQPDLVIDLHEGFDFHIANSKSVGSSIIYGCSVERDRLAGRMQQAVNATVDNEQRRFVLLPRTGGALGSLVRASGDWLGIDAFILETTFKDQPISLRSRQHRTMVSALLQEVGMLERDCVDILGPEKDTARLRVALYDAAGASNSGLENITRAIDSAKEVSLTRVGPIDVQSGAASQFDVLLFPGGSGSKQGRALGERGREAVRQFVREGGGIVGVCAGAYLCSAHYDWSLHVINTAVYNKTIDLPDVGRKSMWYRGKAKDVRMQIAPAAREILGQTGGVKVRYQNGPIISPGAVGDLPDFTPLAWFRSEVALYEPQRGTMIDTPAIASAEFGKGRVISISPHPEATPGLEPILVNALKWAARRVRR